MTTDKQEKGNVEVRVIVPTRGCRLVLSDDDFFLSLPKFRCSQIPSSEEVADFMREEYGIPDDGRALGKGYRTYWHAKSYHKRYCNRAYSNGLRLSDGTLRVHFYTRCLPFSDERYNRWRLQKGFWLYTSPGPYDSPLEVYYDEHNYGHVDKNTLAAVCWEQALFSI